MKLAWPHHFSTNSMTSGMLVCGVILAETVSLLHESRLAWRCDL